VGEYAERYSEYGGEDVFVIGMDKEIVEKHVKRERGDDEYDPARECG